MAPVVVGRRCASLDSVGIFCSGSPAAGWLKLWWNSHLPPIPPLRSSDTACLLADHIRGPRCLRLFTTWLSHDPGGLPPWINISIVIVLHEFAVSSVVSGDTTPLCMRPLALHWLSALHIALHWLYIALHWLPALHIALRWLPIVLHISRTPNWKRICTPYTGYLHWLPVLHIALHWLPTRAPSIRFYLKDSHKSIFKNETPIRIPNFICFEEIIST